MSDSAVGTVGWMDLTVDNAEEVRDFYQAVVGWEPSPVDMGGYSDFTMNVEGAPVGGVCHARGGNTGLPPVWLFYVNVADLDESIAACTANGGVIVAGPKDMGEHGRYCVVKDPAGAPFALFQTV
ncbi:MAG: VOC family protein [Acidobacteriota bacterium]